MARLDRDPAGGQARMVAVRPYRVDGRATRNSGTPVVRVSAAGCDGTAEPYRGCGGFSAGHLVDGAAPMFDRDPAVKQTIRPSYRLATAPERPTLRRRSARSGVIRASNEPRCDQRPTPGDGVERQRDSPLWTVPASPPNCGGIRHIARSSLVRPGSRRAGPATSPSVPDPLPRVRPYGLKAVTTQARLAASDISKVIS